MRLHWISSITAQGKHWTDVWWTTCDLTNATGKFYSQYCLVSSSIRHTFSQCNFASSVRPSSVCVKQCNNYQVHTLEKLELNTMKYNTRVYCIHLWINLMRKMVCIETCNWILLNNLYILKVLPFNRVFRQAKFNKWIKKCTRQKYLNFILQLK